MHRHATRNAVRKRKRASPAVAAGLGAAPHLNESAPLKKETIMEVEKIKFDAHTNNTGNLVFLEGNRDIPFNIKRVYYLYGIKKGERRGLHAHKDLQQAYICLHGSCKVLLDDGKEKTNVLLDSPDDCLLFTGGVVWREIYEFSQDAVLLVLASEHYDEEDYIRNYDDFVKYINMEAL